MRKLYFLFLLYFVMGCASTQATSNIPTDYVWKKSGPSIVIGKIKFVGIPPELQHAAMAFEDEVSQKVYPVKLGLPDKPAGEESGPVEYYFFVELPEGRYRIPEVLARHSRFMDLGTHLLNANLTIKKNTIVYVGTILIKGQGRGLEHVGPITHADIVDEFPQVTQVFLQRYPQFQNNSIEKSVIDRYRWFSGEHIETDFDKDFGL